MALFRRRPGLEETGISSVPQALPIEQSFTSACVHLYDACLGGCALQTLPAEAKLYDAEQDIDRLNALEESSATWMARREEMRPYIDGVTMTFGEMYDGQVAVRLSDTRELRRARQNNTYLRRLKAQEANNSILMYLRDPAIASVYDRHDKKMNATARELLGGGQLDAIAYTQDGSKDAPLRTADQEISIKVGESQEMNVPNMFVSLYSAELSSRTELARVLYSDPAFGRLLLKPRTLDVLPEGVRSLIANEIVRPTKDSIVQGFLHTYPPEDDVLSFTEYIQHNHHTESVRTSIATLATGACVAGAPGCPANKYGLCAGIMATLSEATLPEVIQSDFEKARIETSRQAMHELMVTAQRYATDEIFSSGATIKPVGILQAGASKKTPAKRSSHRQASPQRAVPSRQEAEQERHAITIKFTDATLTTLDVLDINDKEQLEESIQNIIQSSGYQKYIQRHAQSSDKLEAFFAAALREILSKDRFTAESNGVRKYANTAGFTDGEHTYPWYRISATDFTTSDTSDRVVNGTRLFFAAGSDKAIGKRVVYLHPDPFNKQEIVDVNMKTFLPKS